MSQKEKINPVYILPALAFGVVFKQADFTKEQVELYFELDYYFLKNLKQQNKVVKNLIKYHRQLKEAIIKLY